MSDHAPELGAPTDIAIGDETAALLMAGDVDGARRRAESLVAREPAVDTPDELGGTGGEQAGGAG